MGAPSQAAAQDEQVVRRLSRHGDLGKAQAKRLVSQIDRRMKRSADMTQSRTDPLRAVVNKAVLGSPVAPDAMAAAKVRLRLYAGLNEWALEKLLAPRQGAVAGCVQVFGVSQKECEALVAAAGKISVADARKAGGGPARVAGAQPSVPRLGTQPAAAPRAAPQPSRFRRPPSRFGTYRAPARTAGVQQQRPAARPVQRAAPRAKAPAVARTNTKEEYQRRRQAYLERQRKRMEERKAKLRAASGQAKVDRGPASEDEAKLVGADKGAEKPAEATPAAKDGAEPKPSEAVAEKKSSANPPMDAEFLDGLLDDPLGE